MTPLPLADSTIELQRHDLSAAPGTSDGPHEACDGWTMGVASMPPTPPHRGERHPDGDEVLYVYDGTAAITLELSGGHETVTVTAGQAFVVPRGIWHRVEPNPTVTLLYVTPCPNQEHRPL